MRWVQLLAVGLVAFAVACGGATTDGHDDGGSVVAVAEEHDGDEHDASVATTHDDGDEHDATVATTHDDGDEHDATALTEFTDEAVNLVVDLTLTNFAYEPKLIVANVGDLLKLHVENDTYGAVVPHDFTIERIDADVVVLTLPGDGEHAHNMDMEAADLHFALTDAGTGEVFVRLNEPGIYVFYCTVPGHRALGMEGVLRVN